MRPVVTVSLSADHRATDGATGARYLSALDSLDFLGIVELLSERSGQRIDEDD